MKVYAEYCANSDNAIEALVHLSKQSDFAAYDTNLSITSGHIKLNGFIIKPVQRYKKFYEIHENSRKILSALKLFLFLSIFIDCYLMFLIIFLI